MIKPPRCLFPLLPLAASLALAIASCATPPKPPTDDELVAAGARAFASGDLIDAEREWARLADGERRGLMLAYLRSYSSFAEAVVRAERILDSSGPAPALDAAAAAAAPTNPPAAIRPDPLAAEERLGELAARASAALDEEAATAERAAEGQVSAAQAAAPKAAAEAYSAAIEDYRRAGGLYSAASPWSAEAAAGLARVTARSAAAEEARRSAAKALLLGFPERMGAIFARQPRREPGKLDDRSLLSFNAETSALIAAGLADFDRTAAANPGLLDPSVLARLRDSARELSARFERVESAIKSIKDCGRPVIPVIIGIFNPQPGDPTRSRPAAFAGAAAGGSDWWWGLVDIPKGAVQDLVVTLSDDRPVRVYATGIDGSGKRPTVDLVNRNFKVGNSWPVLNAGVRLADGVFHVEVDRGAAGAYNGEAVIYKSFMTRTR